MDKLAIPIFILLFIGVVFLILDTRGGYLRKIKEKLNQNSDGQHWIRFIGTIRLVCGFSAAGLFMVVSVINVCTWISSGIARHTHTLMWLHLWTLIAFFICIAFAQQNRRPGDRGIALRGMPKWTNSVLTALGIYALSLMAFHAVYSHGGYSISERDGKHYIKSDGQTEREMSTAEYLQDELMDLRGFSGLWMGFSFCAGAYLLFAHDGVSQTITGISSGREVVH